MSISATIVAHSKSAITGKEIVTYKVTHHRFILAEMNKHRMLSNSYQSSRAVPVDKMIESVKTDLAYPISFGKNQAGMQSEEELDGFSTAYAKYLWGEAANEAGNLAEGLAKIGLHKQLANRLTEPFQWTTGIITGTEWNNFFHLRRDKAAQPEFKALADAMWEAYQDSEPEVLQPGEWHTPFVDHRRHTLTDVLEYEIDGEPFAKEDALRYSAASCAQISFRKLDQNIETLERVWDRCFNNGIPHAVVAEHQASPMHFPTDELCGWEKGATHSDIDQNMWSGNFQGWVQHRQLIKDNVMKG